MLKEAKSNCDYLIVGLQTDPSIDRPTTKHKPIQTLFERYIQLSACKYIDEIIPYSTENELVEILSSYPIHIRFIGEEYKDKDFTGKELPIEIYYNSRKNSFSTSSLRKRIHDAENKNDSK